MTETNIESTNNEIIKANEEKQIAYAVVLKADRPDLEKDVFPAEVVEKAAHDFMVRSQDINLEHEFDTDKVKIVESFVAPTDLEINGDTIKKNDWVMAVKFLDSDLWGLAKSGGFSGFSVEGRARKVPASEVA